MCSSDLLQFGPGNYMPTIGIAYWSFRLMIGAGLILTALSAWALVQLRRRRLEASPRLLMLLMWAIGLPLLANSLGWLFTEMGRQPWIVYGLLGTADSVSPTVTAASVALSLAVFTLLYGGLAVIEVRLLVGAIKKGPPVDVLEETPADLTTRPPALVY